MPEGQDWENGGFGVYVHWPFCQAKCPYCDFNSHVVSQIDQDQWKVAYLQEIDRIGAQTQGRVLNSVFFGGGTPSLMDPDVVEAVLTRIRKTWRTVNDFEVTLEANPTSVEASRFEGYRDAGVNRISMGIQALNDVDLRALGRLHSAREAMEAFEIARGIFDRVSFDLIYARQNQSLDQWQTELQQALALAVDHFSLYQLTIEDGTAFGDRYKAGKLRGLPDEDLSADMYEATQDICAAAGLPAYEVSNHARPGAESAHNQVYWRYGDYAGIGPGAHGRLTLCGVRHATVAHRAPGAWLEAVRSHGDGDIEVTPLHQSDQVAEFLLMGLRLTDGVDLTRLDCIKNDGLMFNINNLVYDGYLTLNQNRLFATARGRPVLNGVLRQLLAG